MLVVVVEQNSPGSCRNRARSTNGVAVADLGKNAAAAHRLAKRTDAMALLALIHRPRRICALRKPLTFCDLVASPVGRQLFPDPKKRR